MRFPFGIHKLIYDLGILGYALGIGVASIGSKKARKFISSRRNSLQNQIIETKQGKRIWIHASSLGEFEQGRPVIEGLRTSFPDVSIVLTFFSPSGFEIRKDYDQADHILYMPLDTPANARNFMSLINPDLVVFIKYDFWINHLKECFRQKIPVVFVSSRFRKDQIYFKMARSLFLPVFRKINHFFVQDEGSRSILERKGIVNVSVVGDTRIDRVISVVVKKETIPVIDRFCHDFPTFIFGSIWPSDLSMVTSVMETMEHFKVIIAPHSLSDESIQNILNRFPGSVRYSKIRENEDLSRYPILILDTMGMLSSTYQYGKYAYVGGAFRGALHNILEPAAHGIPVFYGDHPANQKFPEADELRKEGGGMVIKDGAQMLKVLSDLEKDQGSYKRACSASRRYIFEREGSTEKVVDHIKNWLT